MADNCNYVAHEGRCDGAVWMKCTYCGAIDNEPCRNIPIKVESREEMADRILKNALFKIKSKPLAPYELQEVVIHILDRLDQKNIKEQR